MNYLSAKIAPLVGLVHVRQKLKLHLFAWRLFFVNICRVVNEYMDIQLKTHNTNYYDSLKTFLSLPFNVFYLAHKS